MAIDPDLFLTDLHAAPATLCERARNAESRGDVHDRQLRDGLSIADTKSVDRPIKQTRRNSVTSMEREREREREKKKEKRLASERTLSKFYRLIDGI